MVNHWKQAAQYFIYDVLAIEIIQAMLGQVLIISSI